VRKEKKLIIENELKTWKKDSISENGMETDME